MPVVSLIGGGGLFVRNKKAGLSPLPFVSETCVVPVHSMVTDAVYRHK